eukprot:scaffold243604_cov31-Tisochrysis_lutea.AAC.2
MREVQERDSLAVSLHSSRGTAVTRDCKVPLKRCTFPNACMCTSRFSCGIELQPHPLHPGGPAPPFLMA